MRELAVEESSRYGNFAPGNVVVSLLGEAR
jgi:hypothetical protein